MQVKRKMSGGKSAHSFYPAPGIYHLRSKHIRFIKNRLKKCLILRNHYSWKWCRLSDIIDVRDGTHDSPKYVPMGIPLVTSKNLSNGTIDYGNVKYITQEDADKINARSMVDDDDILFAMIGSIGNPVLVKKDREFSIKNMALFKKFADTDISMQYMYWFFYAQYKLKKEASGGVQSFISLSRFREYLVPLPPYEEQIRIAIKIEQILPLCERLK